MRPRKRAAADCGRWTGGHREPTHSRRTRRRIQDVRPIGSFQGWQGGSDYAHRRTATDSTGCGEQHIGLIVVDVLISFLGSDTNSYKGQDIRAQVMAPLKRLCEETGCTVIALRHLNKGQGAAIYRGGGSIGIVGAVRAAFLMAKDPENGGQRLFAPVKFNLGPMPRTLAYRLEDNPLLGCAHVRWLGETDDTAESLNQSAYGTSEREDSDVRTFIQDYFDHNKELTPDGLYGGVPSYRVINEAKGEFSKQQVLDGRRRPKPLLASKKYGNMWW